jgi:tetratricopeptide (TPR) repeat protein
VLRGCGKSAPIAFPLAAIPEVIHEVMQKQASMRQPSTASGADDVLTAILAEYAGDEAPPWSLVGQRVGSIRIHRLLGEGGMGAVYAGYDERLQREVALKVVRFDSLTVNGRARLLSEARILSRLNHPGICAIHDFVSGEATDFLVLELIHGTTLREAITRGIAPEARLGIAERIAEALVAAHAQGVIHRDLKPSNVMLTGDDQVKVLDFGIARRGHGRGTGGDDADSPHADPERTATLVVEAEEFLFARTTPGKVIGTAGCMSPEQARGEAVTVASDMYSFGLLLQELFTGESAYAPTLTGAELLKAVQKGRTLPLARMDAHLAALIERLKSLAPEDRPSAAEALHRLRWIGEKPRRRRRAIGAGVALLAVSLGVARYTSDLRRERDAAVAARQQAEISRRAAEEVEGFLVDLFKVADPGEGRGSSVTARELLDQGARKVGRELRGQPRVQARLLDTIGEVYFKLGLLREARPLLEQSLRLRHQGAAGPLELSLSLEHLALLAQAEHQPQAESLLRRALRAREAALGAEHPDVGVSLAELANLYVDQQRYREAEPLYRRALAIFAARALRRHPAQTSALLSYARLLRATGRGALAAAMEERAKRS